MRYFYAAAIASAICHPALLFRVIWSLIVLPQEMPEFKKLNAPVSIHLD